MRLVIFYDSFYPAYKAGGPVQSITNLSQVLNGKMEVYALCSAYEIDGSMLENIELNKWNDVLGIKVYYLDKGQNNIKFIKHLISSLLPATLFVNGMFSLWLSIFPILLWKWQFSKKAKLVLSPRGMLQTSALHIKPAKKKLFLSLFKILRLANGIQWHATNAQEKKDIQKIFGSGQQVTIIPNIPKVPTPAIALITKEESSLKLVFISLITEMKNIVFALQCIREADVPLSFDIYGPVKEDNYWQLCLYQISTMPSNIVIRYNGDVAPPKVQATFANYHAFLLPTKGENFGHAIYECMSVGRPVIISNMTPWQDLEKAKAGFDIALDNKEKFVAAIRQLYQMKQAEYDTWCHGALQIASGFYNKHDFQSEYIELFQ